MKKTEFRIGDLVRILTPEEAAEKYTDLGGKIKLLLNNTLSDIGIYRTHMFSLAGCIYRIQSVEPDPHSRYGPDYYLEGSEWIWKGFMLCPAHVSELPTHLWEHIINEEV